MVSPLQALGPDWEVPAAWLALSLPTLKWRPPQLIREGKWHTANEQLQSGLSQVLKLCLPNTVRSSVLLLFSLIRVASEIYSKTWI
jgi:hypothetical protein